MANNYTRFSEGIGHVTPEERAWIEAQLDDNLPPSRMMMMSNESKDEGRAEAPAGEASPSRNPEEAPRAADFACRVISEDEQNRTNVDGRMANRLILFSTIEEARGFVLGAEWVNDGAITVGSPYLGGDGAWVVPAHDSDSDDEEEVWDYRDRVSS